MGDQFVNERAHFEPDGNAESRSRLIGNQDFRPCNERHGDHDALPHAARDFVRV